MATSKRCLISESHYSITIFAIFHKVLSAILMPKTMCYKKQTNDIFSPTINFHILASNKYLLSTCHRSNTILGTGDASVNITDNNPSLHGAELHSSEDRVKQSKEVKYRQISKRQNEKNHSMEGRGRGSLEEGCDFKVGSTGKPPRGKDSEDVEGAKEEKETRSWRGLLPGGEQRP